MTSFAAYGAPVVPSRDERVVVFVPNRHVGAIIGRSGQHVRQVMEQSGAHIRVNSDPTDGGDDDAVRQCVIVGKPDAQLKAQSAIYSKLVEQETLLSGNVAITFNVEMEVPFACIGRLIGKGGARIREISHTSSARINVSGRGGKAKQAHFLFGTSHVPRPTVVIFTQSMCFN